MGNDDLSIQRGQQSRGDGVTERGGKTREYDELNRLELLEQTRNDEVVASYDYELDDAGHRISVMEVNGCTVEYEYYEDDNLKVRYVHGLDLISIERDGEVSVYLVDGLGSTRVLMDLDGEVVATYSYDAFGELLGSTGEVENDYLFAGEQFDGELEQYYLRQRFYEPGIGQFTRRDTYEGGLSDPLSLHKYQYAHLNPVNNIDPTGLFTINDVLAGLEVLDTLIDVASFVADPSFSSGFLLLLGEIGFPPGFDKAFKNIYGGDAKNIANGLEAGLKSLGGTELHTASKLQDAGLVNLLADKNLGKL